MKAYLFIATSSEEEQKVVDSIQQFPEVEKANIVFGEWDIVALLETESPEKLGSFVMEKIRKLPEVRLTSTMILWDSS